MQNTGITGSVQAEHPHVLKPPVEGKDAPSRSGLQHRGPMHGERRTLVCVNVCGWFVPVHWQQVPGVPPVTPHNSWFGGA